MAEIRKRSFLWLSRGVKGVGIALILVVLVLLAPAIAQKNLTAPIVIDGQEVFQVGSAGEFTAEARAEAINSNLEDAIRAQEPIQVRLEQRNSLPTILLNDRYLLTVTQADIIAPEMTPAEQGKIWSTRLEQALERAQEQRSATFLRQAWFLTICIVGVAGVLHLGLGRIWERSLLPTMRQWFPPSDSTDGSEQPQAINVLLNLLLAIARTALWLGVILYVTNLFPWTRQWSYRVVDSLISSLTLPLITLGQSSFSVIDLFIFGLMLVGLILFAGMVTNVLQSRILRVTGVHRGAQEAVAIIVRYGLIFIGTLALLQIWGLDISSLAILASALGVGIGFGLQDIAKNFGSGLVLVFERPIQVGDFVEVGEFQGTVERIGARSTLIRTLDQISIIVPNSRFLEQEVINWSHDNPVSRIHLPVGVAYGSDIETVKSALLEAARHHPKVLSSPPPQVFFKGFGDSSLDVELLVWTAEPSRQIALKSDLYFRMEALLRQHQVEIPFPQRDLHLQVDHLPIELSPQFEQVLRLLLEQTQNGSSKQDDTLEKENP